MSKAETYNSNIIDDMFDSISSEEEGKIKKKCCLPQESTKGLKQKVGKRKILLSH
jgi:hypothetical protein